MAIKQAIGVHRDMSMYMVCNGVTMDDKKMIGKGSLIEAVINCNPSAVIQQVFHTLKKKGGKKEQSKVGSTEVNYSEESTEEEMFEQLGADGRRFAGDSQQVSRERERGAR